MQEHCVFGTVHLGDQGSKKILTGTHRFGTFRHPSVLSSESGAFHPENQGCTQGTICTQEDNVAHGTVVAHHT